MYTMQRPAMKSWEQQQHHGIYLHETPTILVERASNPYEKYPRQPRQVCISRPQDTACSFAVMTQRNNGASILMLLILAMPRLSVHMAWAAQWSAMGPNLARMVHPDVLKLTSFISPLSGLIVAPIIGVMSDRCTHPWGRRRPYMFWGAVASGICWTLMGFTSQIGEFLGDTGSAVDNDGVGKRTWTAILTIIFYTWMDISVNAVQIANMLLVADLAGDRQITGAAFGMAWASVGALMISAYNAIFGQPQDTPKAFLVMLAVTMCIIVAMVCFLADEVPLESDGQEHMVARFKYDIGAIYEGLATLPRQLLIYAFLMFLALYGHGAYNNNIKEFFGTYVYHGIKEGAESCGKSCTQGQKDYKKGVDITGGIVDAIYNLVSILFSIMLPILVREFGAKDILTFSMIPQALLTVLALYAQLEIDVSITILVTITGTALLLLSVPVVIHVLGDNVDIGMYVGAMNSANCIGQTVNMLIGNYIAETHYGVRFPIFLGGILCVLGIIVSRFLQLELYSL